MKGKLMLHYALSFILACLVIFLINVIFMRSSIYKEGALYNYHPEEIITKFKNYINISQTNEIQVQEEGLAELKENQMGLQIIDSANREVFAYNKPDIAPVRYSNVELVNLYSSEETTVFLEEKIIGEETYTYLLFLDANQIKRIIYAYDAELVEKAHKFPVLIGINIILMLIISFLYTLTITRPINRIMSRILVLSEGEYTRCEMKKGIYLKVEECLNQLADKLRNNENEREKLEEMREEWISNISHDIKTPLTSIMGNAEIMADIEYPIVDEARAKYCQTIIAKSEYIKTLVEDLNLSTRLKNNTLTLCKKNINLVSLLRHVLIDVINDEKYPDKQIHFQYEAQEIWAEVDEQLMKRVFINLIINAFVHNHQGVEVSINIYKRGHEEVCITIEDDGKGVSEEELKSIFKRYYRGTHTNKKIQGSGLGMAIAGDIIKVHGGMIKATSTVGEGLKLMIQL